MAMMARCGFMAATMATGVMCFVLAGVGIAAKASQERWITKVGYDKGLGLMRQLNASFPDVLLVFGAQIVCCVCKHLERHHEPHIRHL